LEQRVEVEQVLDGGRRRFGLQRWRRWRRHHILDPLHLVLGIRIVLGELESALVVD